MEKIKKAVILAGGLGTRFLPATLVLAKELFPICDMPILMYHLEDLSKAGITDVLIIGNELKDSSFESFINPSNDYIYKIEKDGKAEYLERYFNLMHKFKTISYIDQITGSDYFNEVNGMHGEKRGSSIAVLSAYKWADGDPFMVLNGDDFIMYNDGRSTAGEIIDVFNETGDYAILGREMNPDVIYKYSAMVLGKKLNKPGGYKMNDIVEKPERGTQPSNIMGFAKYIFKNDVFDRILHSAPRTNGEYCITDVVSEVAKEGHVSTFIFDGEYYDCGSKLGLQMAGNYILFQNETDRAALIEQFEQLKNRFK